MKSVIAAVATTALSALVLSGCSTPSAGGSDPAQSKTPSGQTTPSKQEVKYYENGDHVVGTDIKAGVYRGEVEESAIALCTASQTTEAGKVMDIRNANEGSVIFTVASKPGSVVSFSGCANTAKASDVIRKDAEPSNGWFLVGSELAPGKYSGKVDTESMVKLGTAVQHNARGNVMDIRNANAGRVVFTVKKSPGSVVSFSGFSAVKKLG